MTPNLAASVHQRLLNHARATGRPFNDILQHFALERFLYRMGRSPYLHQFVLKGALMLTAWQVPYPRPTRDIDLLGHMENTVEHVISAIKTICQELVEDDGLRFDTEKVIIELSKRGYHLGIIANTITETEIPDWLEEAGLSQYFGTVILSSIFGRRKPGPEIYLEAARSLGVDPARSVYVGDNPSRDIVGTRRAGFAMTILLMEPDTLKKEPATGDEKPELVIHQLSELLDIFPGRHVSGDGS